MESGEESTQGAAGVPSTSKEVEQPATKKKECAVEAAVEFADRVPGGNMHGAAGETESLEADNHTQTSGKKAGEGKQATAPGDPEGEGAQSSNIEYMGTVNEEGEIVYSKQEIKSQMDTIKGFLGNVAKKKKVVNVLMGSEENLGKVREALSDYSMQFNKFTCANAMLVQMYGPEQVKEKGDAEKRYQEKDADYNSFAEVVGHWISRAEKNLAEQLGDSASMVSGVSKVSKASKYSKISKSSSRSKKSCHSRVKEVLNDSEIARVTEEARIAEYEVALNSLQEEQALRNKLETIALQRKLVAAKVKKEVYEKAERRRSSAGEAAAVTVSDPQTTSSNVELQLTQATGVEMHPSQLEGGPLPGGIEPKNTDIDECFVEAGNSFQRVVSDQVKSFAILKESINRTHSTSDLNPEAPAWPEVGRSLGIARTKSESDGLQTMSTGEGGVLEKYLATIQKPTRRLAVFRGEKTAYKSFIRGFETQIASRVDTDGERLDFLLQYVEGVAKEIIEGCDDLDEHLGYKEARRLLERRFGKACKGAQYEQKLLNWPEIALDDAEGLESYATFLGKCLNAASVYAELSHLDHERTLQSLAEKLPSVLRFRWCDYASEAEEKTGVKVKFKDLYEFAERAARSANNPYFSRKAMKELKASKPVQGASTTRIRAQSTSFATESRSEATKRDGAKCTYCGMEGHHVSQCGDFDKLSIDEKQATVISKGMCWACLGLGHRAAECPRRMTCDICKQRHPTIMHTKERRTRVVDRKKENVGAIEAETVEVSEHCVGSTSAMAVDSCESVIYHGVLPVYVYPKGKPAKKILTYGLFDNGSTGCFMTTDLKDRLGLEGAATSLKIRTMHGCSVVQCWAMDGIMVADTAGRNVVELPPTFTRDDIPVSKNQIPRSERIHQWPHLREVAAQMPRFYEYVNVGILIGSNCTAALQPLEIVPLVGDSPYAVRLRHGWTLHGPIEIRDGEGTINVNHITAEKFEDVREMMVNMFESENDGYREMAETGEVGPSVEDEKFMKIIREGLRHDGTRFSAPLPLKNSEASVPNSKAQAVKRLIWQKKRMQKDEEYEKEYVAFMEKMIAKGHAKMVPRSDNHVKEEERWYLPHHGVMHPVKKKLRVVLDASAKSEGVCLNSQLLQGPNFMNNLAGVLCRFRMFEVAFVADVEAMFYQIEVHREHRRYLRFLWWPGGDTEKGVEEYEMRVHPFGAVSSPSVANYVLRETGERFAREERVRRTMQEDFYVDDVLTSCEGVTEACSLVEGLKECCKAGGFNLTKFYSNSREVLSSIEEEDRIEEAKRLDLQNDELPTERTLGLVWEAEGDQFRFTISPREKPFTRRGVLAVISSVYDPLGFVAPVVLPAKRILQELCRMYQLGWDDGIPEEHRGVWDQWTRDLPKLQDVPIERCLKLNELEGELHCFSDASMAGTAAVVYVRQLQKDGTWSLRFVMGKAKVAPVKAAITVPKLELAAAAMSAKLAATVRRELRWTGKVYFHTDSEIVWYHIMSEQRRLPVYVSNRVREIRSLSSPGSWGHVVGQDNPADEGSRGLTTKDFEEARWLKGPKFLEEHKGSWARRKPEIGLRAVDIWAVDTTGEVTKSSVLGIVDRLSDWYRVTRAAAKLIVIIRLLEHRANLGAGRASCRPDQSITLEDINRAELLVVRMEQQRCFKEEIEAIERGELVKKNSHIRKLDPMIKDGLLRVGGRLNNANLQEETKHPILLPKSGRVTELLVMQYHRKQGHMGNMQVLAASRDRFWVIGGATTVGRIINSCVICRRITKKTESQKMAHLPETRCEEGPPFSEVGLVCFGPVSIKSGRKTVKRWGALFTCMSSRAVHIEVLWSMDTSSILSAIRRLVSRRGNVRSIKSDNGTNFVGASNELQEELNKIDQQVVKEKMEQEKIQWSFIPPYSPHMGGVWERQVKTLKEVFYKILVEHRGQLDDESLQTLFCEAESIVNNRPLTVVSADPRDPLPLSPNALLTLRKKPTYPPTGAYSEVDIYAKKRWKRVQHISNVFWKRWKGEFLTSLQTRSKWQGVRRKFQRNDIVLIKELDSMRNEWPLGRIVELHESRDDLPRAAKIRTGKRKIIDRGVQDLVLLVPGGDDDRERRERDSC